MEFFSEGLKNEFKIAVVNEPSVFEPLKFYCNQIISVLLINLHHELIFNLYQIVEKIEQPLCIYKGNWLSSVDFFTHFSCEITKLYAYFNM